MIVDSDGSVIPKEQTLFETNVYKKGNLLKLEDITNGYIKADGTVKNYDTLWCSGFCEVEQGKLYVKGCLASQYFAFYDENKNVVSTYQDGAMVNYTTYIYTIDVPTNAKYFRCSFNEDPRITTKYFFVSNIAELPSSEDDVKCVENVYPYTLHPSNPCDYQDLTVGVFNKCACIGDSLTYGAFNNSSTSTENPPSSEELSAKYSYPSQFKKITGVETVNFGRSGVTSVAWYDLYKNSDFSGYDMAIIHLGVNDGAKDVSDEDTQTALTNIINLLKNSVKNIKIYLCTIIPAYSNIESSTMTSKSALIRTFYNTNYSDDSNVVLLDMEKYGHAKKYTSYCSGHLSALGYYEFARDLARYISWHIDNNLRDYRSIQFIGNNGEYNAD